MLQELHHPNIVTLYEVFAQDEVLDPPRLAPVNNLASPPSTPWLGFLGSARVSAACAVQGTLSLVFDYLPTDLEMMINARDPGKEPYVALPSGDTKVPPTSILHG